MATLEEEISRILATIRQLESRGNYTARNPTSSASGAYQFTDPTWRGAGGLAYAPSAYKATPAQQDSIARAYVRSIIAAHPDKKPTVVVPRIWYVGTLDLPDSHKPDNNTLTVGQYALRWLVEYAKQGSGVGLGDAVDAARNPIEAAKAIRDSAVDSIAGPLLEGIRKLVIIGIAVAGGMTLVVVGAWRGVRGG